MKKIFFILFVVLTISNNSNSQTDFSQDVHKYLVYQAVKLLQVKYPDVINSNPEFFYWLSNKNQFNWEEWYNTSIGQGFPYMKGSLYTGACREDNEDVIDNICGGPWAPAYVTLSHFWDADGVNGDNAPVPNPDPFQTPPENAYKKIRKYWFGNYGEGISIGPNLDHSSYYFSFKVKFGTGTNNENLAQAYNEIRNGNLNFLYVTKDRIFYDECSDKGWSMVNQGFYDYLTSKGWNSSQIEDKAKKIIFETLGRICHLLGDMAVPAHAHNEVHADWDFYELNLNDIYNNDNYRITWNSNNVFNKGIVNVNTLNNPLKGLAYLINQSADRMPCLVGNPWQPGGKYTQGDDSWIGNAYGSDYNFFYNNINPLYASITDVPLNAPLSFSLCTKIHYHTFPIAIRSIAGFIDYFFKQTTYNIPEPQIACIYQTPYVINPNTMGEITCELAGNQDPFDYEWTWSATNVPTDVSWQPYYNKCNVHRWPPPPPPTDQTFENPPFKLAVTVRKKNSINYSLTYIHPRFTPNIIGGCPWLNVRGIDTIYKPENNILHKSLLPSNYGVEIKDKYIIKNQPLILNNKIFLNIVETNNDSSIINRVKLYAIDHPVSKKIAITEDNTIVTYDSSSVIDNIYSTLFDPEYNFTEITDNILFHKEQRNNVIGDSLYNLYSEFKYNSGQNPSIIVNVKRNPSYPVNKDSYTGIIIGHTPNGSFQNQFIRRENPDNFIFPIGTKNIYGSVDSAHISWDKSFDIRYLAVASVSYSGYTLTELPLSLAYHTLDGDVTNNLNYVDSLTSYISENHYLNLEFQNIENYSNEGIVREYIIEVDGKVLQAGSQRMSLMNKVKENNQIPKLFSLSQNYPNPFNPVTNIKYQIPINTFVTVKVYDILGKEVKTLVNEFKSVGNYSVLFDASSLASGIYFYKMSAGEFSDVKRMVLVK